MFSLKTPVLRNQLKLKCRFYSIPNFYKSIDLLILIINLKTNAMKKIILLALVGTFLLVQSCGKSEKKVEPLTEVQARNILAKYEEDFKVGQQKRDRAALENLISDNFIFITPEGKMIRKKTMIDVDLMAGQPEFDEFKPTIENYFVSDNMIVTTGFFDNKGTLNGKDISGRYRNLEMYQKVKDEWQLVISHLTKVEAEQ